MIRRVPACAVKQSGVKLAEHAGTAVIERTVDQRVDGTPDAHVRFIQGARVVAPVQSGDLPDRRAKDIVVFHSGALNNFDIRPVERTERHRAVEHKFHIARAAGFGAGGRNLFGDVGGRDQFFGV